jgi:hypothetical protein
VPCIGLWKPTPTPPESDPDFTSNLNHEKWEIFFGKQEFRRTDFGSRFLEAEGEGGGGSEGEGGRGQLWVRTRGVSEVKQYPSGSG